MLWLPRDDYQKTRVNTGMSVYACSHYLFKRQPVFALFRVIFALLTLKLAGINEESYTCVVAPTAGEHHSSCPWRWCNHARVQFLVKHTRVRFSLVLAPTAGEHHSSCPWLWCNHARVRFLVNHTRVWFLSENHTRVWFVLSLHIRAWSLIHVFEHQHHTSVWLFLVINHRTWYDSSSQFKHPAPGFGVTTHVYDSL